MCILTCLIDQVPFLISVISIQLNDHCYDHSYGRMYTYMTLLRQMNGCMMFRTSLYDDVWLYDRSMR